MIIAVTATLKDVFLKGKEYPWPKPSQCPKCGNMRVWGHGFVLAWFDECTSLIYLRRYRCPECHCVIRLKPQGYFERFHCLAETIRTVISRRIETGRWPGGFSRSRQGHWLRALMRKAKAYLSDRFEGDPVDAFDRLSEMDKVPVSRSI